MSIWKVLAAIFGPAVFWIGYFYYKDRFQPEPLVNLLEAYFLGFLFGVFCFYFYKLLPLVGIPSSFLAVLAKGNKVEIFAYSIAVVGVVEETFKFLPFILIILRFRAFDELIDGVIYASALAVGFASFENLGYLPHMKGFVFFGRAFASPLTHTIFSSIWGYTIGTAQIKGKSLIKPSLIGVLIAAFFHGLFNFLTVSPTLRALSALLILVIWIWLIRFLEKWGRSERHSEFIT
jgi:RsiW-degrading membrane proteinase PrsW (M82 family)